MITARTCIAPFARLAAVTALAFAACNVVWAGTSNNYYFANVGAYYYASDGYIGASYAMRDNRYPNHSSNVLPVLSAQIFPLGIGKFSFGGGIGHLPLESISYVVKDNYETFRGQKSNLAGKRVSYSAVDMPLLLSGQYSITESIYASVGGYALAYHLTESSVAVSNNPCSKKLLYCPRSGSFVADIPASVLVGLGYRHKFEGLFLQGQVDVWYGWRNSGFLHVIPQVGIGRVY